MGLRVTSQIDDRWWLRVGLRTAVFHVPTVIPTLFFMGATSGSTAPAYRLHGERCAERMELECAA